MKFDLEATGVGSVPFKDPKQACQIIFKNFKSIPFWPQLPKRSYLENMYVQFSEGLPGCVLDEKPKTFHIDSRRALDGLEGMFEKYLAEDIDFFKISKPYAEGFYAFLETLKNSDKEMKFVKGHITGPISFALSVTDENKRAIIYNKDLFQAITKLLVMKARWQIKKLKEFFPNVIIFIDEPYLVSIGSSYVTINLDEAIPALDEAIDLIKADGALVGVHCCGNTDWPVLLKRGVDILSFDAYNFIKEFFLYMDEVKSFLSRGGTIAWGIVPSSAEIDKTTLPALQKKLKEGLALLIDKGIAEETISSIVTPSCGVGSLDEDRANKVLETCQNISNFRLGRLK